MAEKLPYVPGYGIIAKALNKIKVAATPERFTQDFLSTKLALKGGTPKPVIPFLKRMGFLGSDGVPTDLYKRFRNSPYSGGAAAEALKVGYQALYQINEYAHDLSDEDLEGAVVQVTGLGPGSGTVKAIMGSFKALKEFARFDREAKEASAEQAGEEVHIEEPVGEPTKRAHKLGLSYTINLNLPATSDIAVFNAIFKSLREHLLR